MAESRRLSRLQGILKIKMLIALNRSAKFISAYGMHYIEGIRTESTACPTEVKI